MAWQDDDTALPLTPSPLAIVVGSERMAVAEGMCRYGITPEAVADKMACGLTPQEAFDAPIEGPR
jgi:hypothetical protein